MKYVLITLLFLPFGTWAQQPLAIGDKMPDWKFTPLVNGKGPLQLSRYKGKAVMLCFWASTCGGSLDMLPKTDELEKKFTDFKSVFVVDDKEAAKPVALMNKREKLKALGIPLMNRDTALLKLFPHSGGPHIVLIGRDGTVKAITGATYVNEKTVADLVMEKEIRLPLQKIGRPHEHTLLEDGLLESKDILYNSVLTGYMDGVTEATGSVSLPGNRFRLKADNRSMIQLYIWAYTREMKFELADPFKRIVLNVKDKKRWGIGVTDPLETGYKYCYELTMPAGDKMYETAFEYVKKDMDRYFNSTAKVENRQVTCYILVAKDSIGSIPADPNDQYGQHWPRKSDLHNYPLKSVAAYLNKAWKEGIVLAESESAKRYSLELANEYTSLEEVKKDLQAKGFDLIPAKREMKFLVLTDK